MRLRPGAGREEAAEAVREAAEAGNEMAELAFYAGRDLARCDGRAWFKAAVERSPVCTGALAGTTLDEAARAVESLEETSLYEGPRGAQPDEVKPACPKDSSPKNPTQRFSPTAMIA